MLLHYTMSLLLDRWITLDQSLCNTLHWKETANSQVTGWPLDVMLFYVKHYPSNFAISTNVEFRRGDSVMFASQMQANIFIVASVEDSTCQSVIWDPCSQMFEGKWLLNPTLSVILQNALSHWNSWHVLFSGFNGCFQLREA